MSEKSAEALLPLITDHMVTIPNDVQQLTIKDSTVFIGKDHSRNLKTPCCRRLNMVTTILGVIIVVFILLPTLYHLRKLVSINGTVDSGYYVSLNRDMLNPLATSMNNVERAIASFSDAFNQDKLRSTKSESNMTILYLSRDPPNSLDSYFQFTSVYIARSYQTTLSFFIQNNQSYTYLDDVSVNNSYGSQLIVNGGFDSGTYGWQGLSGYTSYCSNYYSSSYSKCAHSGYAPNGTVSQTFSTSPGTVLYISFKLRWDRAGSGIFTSVTIYP